MAATLQSAAGTARTQSDHLTQTLRGLEEDLRRGLEGSDRIPQAWHGSALATALRFKPQITRRVAADVATVLKAMRRGHLTRMNAVLRGFMQARLAGVVTGPEQVREG